LTRDELAERRATRGGTGTGINRPFESEGGKSEVSKQMDIHREGLFVYPAEARKKYRENGEEWVLGPSQIGGKNMSRPFPKIGEV